ncbi:hypothetical protein R0J90_16410, partial [Micrococcus sp. SIMBA_144]
PIRQHFDIIFTFEFDGNVPIQEAWIQELDRLFQVMGKNDLFPRAIDQILPRYVKELRDAVIQLFELMLHNIEVRQIRVAVLQELREPDDG